MDTFQNLDSTLLDNAGLNRQAVFNLDTLPEDILDTIRAAGLDIESYSQLILIGHAGRKLWESVTASGIESADPIDDFTVCTVGQWFAACQPQNTYRLIYPSNHPIGLQRLGQLAGWHHPSPFMVGIDQEWGSWFAYRAVAIADTRFEPSTPLQGTSPCDTCTHKICIASCPGAALEGGRFSLDKCVSHRRKEGSGCKATCLARVSCPVGSQHKYCEEQIRHTYSISMRAIERYYK